MITVGVQDFAAQRDFCRRLGWPQAFDSDDFAVFELRGALLALFPWTSWPPTPIQTPSRPGAESAPASSSTLTNPPRWTKWAERACQAGATITKEPVDAEFFTGRE